MSGNGNQVPLAPSQRGPGPYPFMNRNYLVLASYLRNILKHFNICLTLAAIAKTSVNFLKVSFLIKLTVSTYMRIFLI